MDFVIFTDGSTVPRNPGCGGWAYVMLDGRTGEKLSRGSGGERYATINRMELMAIYQAIKAIPAHKSVTVRTDSKYSMNCIMRWTDLWDERTEYASKIRALPEHLKRIEDCDKRWPTVKNRGLIKAIQRQRQNKYVCVEWVPSHRGVYWNEYVDEEAKKAAREYFELRKKE